MARGFEIGLTNKSAKWNAILKGFKQPWTLNTVYACSIAIWSNIIQVFYNKKRSCDHFGGFVRREIYLALWKYDFYDVSLLPIVTRELFVKLVH